MQPLQSSQDIFKETKLNIYLYISTRYNLIDAKMYSEPQITEGEY